MDEDFLTEAFQKKCAAQMEEIFDLPKPRIVHAF